MPTHLPPLPPQVSPVHATGWPYSTRTEQVDMPEDPGYVGPEGKLFNMDDEEDLYGELPLDRKGKVAVERGSQKSDNCEVQ